MKRTLPHRDGACQFSVSTVVDLDVWGDGAAVPPVLIVCRCSARSRSFLRSGLHLDRACAGGIGLDGGTAAM